MYAKASFSTKEFEARDSAMTVCLAYFNDPS